MSMISNEFETTITSDGNAFTIKDLAFDPTYVRVDNLSVRSSPTSTSTAAVSELFPKSGIPSTTMVTSITSSATAYSALTSNGIDVMTFDGATVGSRMTISSITADNPAVVTTSSAHGLATGDRVYIAGATGMTQIEGMVFHITNLTNTTFSLTYLNSTGFSAATGGAIQKVNIPALWNPEGLNVTNVSKAAQAVVTIAAKFDYQVGQLLTFDGFTAFGMTQIEGLCAAITAVNSTNNTVTVDIDSRNFTSFAFPATGGNNLNRPHVIPYGVQAQYVNELVDVYQKPERSIDLRIGSSIAGANTNILRIYARNTTNDLVTTS